MIGARHNIKQAHDDDTNSFYFEFLLNQRINLLKLKKNLISTNKNPPLLRGSCFHPIPLGGGYVLLLSRCSYSRTRDSAQNSVSQHRFPANSILHKNQLTLIINNQPTISALFYPNALIAAGRKFHKNNRLIFPSHFHSGYFWVFLFHLF